MLPISNLNASRPRPRYPEKQLSAASSKDAARALVVKTSGALATVYSCPFCNHHETIRRPPRGHGDRGFGLRTGGPAHARMGAHVRAEHADKVEDIIANARELGRRVNAK